MPRTPRKYDDLFPYGRKDEENVEPITNGAGKNRGSAPSSSGRVPLQPPSRGAQSPPSVGNNQSNFSFMEGAEAEKKRRIQVREREDELTKNLAIARQDANRSGSSEIHEAARRAEKMLNVNRTATSKSRSDWVGIGIVINDPPTCEVLGISPYAETMGDGPYNPVKDDKVRHINEVPLEVLSNAEVRALILGPPGTPVKLDIERYDGTSAEVTFKRKHVGNAAPRPCAPRPAPAKAAPVSARQPQVAPIGGAGGQVRKEEVQLDISRMTGTTPRKEGARADSARGTQGGLFVYQGRVVRQRETVRGGSGVELVELVEVGTGAVVYQGEGVPLGDMTVLSAGAEEKGATERRREQVEGQRSAIPGSAAGKRQVKFFVDDDDDFPPRQPPPKPAAGSVRQQPPQPYAGGAGKLGQLRSGQSAMGEGRGRAPNSAQGPPASVEAREQGPGWNAGAVMCMCVGDRGGAARGAQGAGSQLRQRPAVVSPAPAPAPARPAPPPPQRGVLRKPAGVERREGEGQEGGDEYHSESGTFSSALGVPKPPDALERGFTNMFRHRA